ncbi:uncharacterized protein LOC114521856 [Dendronephthya gigantea]|uniref:uncharacterized protein LOC114521856 n=1 Tax=Dendronephthya gigantea TaxID=151771 RepID=UPI00106C676F|nr:uncharacterized protein LOC114521856 [Dendronephthya gigantea]
MERNYRSCELQICDSYSKNDENYTKYFVLDQQEKIIETAKILHSFSKQFFAEPLSFTDERYYSVGDAYFSDFQSVVLTVDTLIEWLERSGNDVLQNVKKKEAVLRGMLRLTELGSQASLFSMLELACKFLDVPKNPYPAEREYISGTLAEVHDQKQSIYKILREAGETLRRIIDDDTFDISKGMQFDNDVRKVELEIQFCQRRLDGAKKMTVQLMQKMQSVKWFSRAVRAVGILITLYFAYYKYQNSTIAFPIILLGFFVSVIMWLSFFPSNAYGFYEALSKLEAKHRLLDEGLDTINERLRSTTDHKDKVVDAKLTTTSSN